MDNGRLEVLINDIKQGSEDAAWQLVQEYGPHIQAVVSRRLNPSMRRAYDTNDFLQAAWASLFRVLPRLQVDDDPRKFIALLATIACRRLANEFRRRRPLDPEQLNGSSNDDESGPSPHLQPSREPTPGQVMDARERWQRMIQSMPQHHVAVIKLRMQGMTQKEIAERTGLTTRTIRRVIDSAFQRHSAGHDA